MLRSLLIGLAAGQRAMTPIAAVAYGLRRKLADDATPMASVLSGALPGGVSAALAAAEMAGDKMRSAPDRTIWPGLLARALSASFAGSILAPRSHRAEGALLAGVTAVGTSFVGLALRRRAVARFGTVPTGVVEDILVLSIALAAVHMRNGEEAIDRKEAGPTTRPYCRRSRKRAA